MDRYDGLTDPQRAVLEPPYHGESTAACNQSLGRVLLKTPMLALCSPGPVFTGRPILGDDGQLDAESQKRVDESGWDGLGGNGAYEETRPRRIAREGWRKASKL